MKKKLASGARPTMLDVAKYAGVSTMTVSRALRQDTQVSDKTRAKVQAAVQELGYVLDQSAGALSSRRTGFVACTLPSLNNSNFADTARGITDMLEPAGLQLLLGYTNYSIDKEEQLVNAFLRRRPESFILTGGTHSANTRRMLRASRIPVVQIWDMPKRPIHHVVGFSNAEAYFALVQALYQRGYRKFGFICGSTNRDARGADRRRGFEQALSELGLDHSRILNFGTPPISIRQGKQALHNMLKQWPDTEAVLFVSDLPAVGALAECARQGWSVPGRVAIAGFGDFEIADQIYPSLTTVNIDCYGIGAQAAQIIKQALAAEHSKAVVPERVQVNYQVKIRESA